jgi:hypothetical protein
VQNAAGANLPFANRVGWGLGFAGRHDVSSV